MRTVEVTLTRDGVPFAIAEIVPEPGMSKIEAIRALAVDLADLADKAEAGSVLVEATPRSGKDICQA